MESWNENLQTEEEKVIMF